MADIATATIHHQAFSAGQSLRHLARTMRDVNDRRANAHTLRALHQTDGVLDAIRELVEVIGANVAYLDGHDTACIALDELDDLLRSAARRADAAAHNLLPATSH